MAKRKRMSGPSSAIEMGVGMGVGIGVMGAGLGVASGAVAGLPEGPTKSMMGMAPLMMAGMAVNETAKMGSKKRKSMW